MTSITGTSTSKTWRAHLRADLIRHEGLRLKTYKDTVGVLTIGVGHTGKDVKPNMVITEEEALQLLDIDMEEAITDARIVCPTFDHLDGPRRTVVANMAFNLGRARLAEFKRTLAAIAAKRYADAALYMLESKWATQVGQRAQELARRMASGKY